MWAVNWQVKKKLPASWLSDALSVFEREFGVKKQEISVTVIGPSQIRKINRQHRGKDKPTNVLSFPISDGQVLGEVFLCPQVIKQEAKAIGLPLPMYFKYILVHGLLHLVGMDHDTDKETAKMEKEEDKLLKKIYAKSKSVKK